MFGCHKKGNSISYPLNKTLLIGHASGFHFPKMKFYLARSIHLVFQCNFQIVLAEYKTVPHFVTRNSKLLFCTLTLRNGCNKLGLSCNKLILRQAFQNPQSDGGWAKWPTGENRLYRPYFCILNIKNHIKGLKGHKSSPQQGP